MSQTLELERLGFSKQKARAVPSKNFGGIVTSCVDDFVAMLGPLLKPGASWSSLAVGKSLSNLSKKVLSEISAAFAEA